MRWAGFLGTTVVTVALLAWLALGGETRPSAESATADISEAREAHELAELERAGKQTLDTEPARSNRIAAPPSGAVRRPTESKPDGPHGRVVDASGSPVAGLIVRARRSSLGARELRRAPRQTERERTR